VYLAPRHECVEVGEVDSCCCSGLRSFHGHLYTFVLLWVSNGVHCNCCESPVFQTQRVDCRWSIIVRRSPAESPDFRLFPATYRPSPRPCPLVPLQSPSLPAAVPRSSTPICLYPPSSTLSSSVTLIPVSKPT